MPTSGASRIRASARFERSYRQLIKSHYRKNPQGREAFEERFAQILEHLETHVDFQGLARVEGWPAGGFRKGWTYYKLAFGMIGLHGAANLGRLLYLHDTVNDVILLVWVYNHAEFEKQPPKQDLLQAMLEAMELEE